MVATSVERKDTKGKAKAYDKMYTETKGKMEEKKPDAKTN